MELYVLGITYRRGVSFKTSPNGKPYEICVLQYLVPVEPRTSQNSEFTGHGYEVREIPAEPASMSQFAAIKFPAMVNVDIQNDPRNLSRTVAHGVLTKEQKSAV